MQDENNKRNYLSDGMQFLKKHAAKIIFLVVIIFLAAGVTLLAAGHSMKSISVEPYQAEVSILEENGNTYLKKTYRLTGEDDSSVISKEDIRWNGDKYHFLELKKVEPEEPAYKPHTEVVTMDSMTKNMKDVLKVIAPVKTIATEDGYRGELILDPASIRIEAKGYKNQNYQVSVTRTYPNLAEADTMLIPKTVTEKGRTLTLKEISWQNARSDYMDGYDLAMRYTAVATYDAKVISQIATGYCVTAEYKGELLNTDMEYEALYEKAGLFSMSNPSGALSVLFSLFALLLVIALLAALAYFGKNQYEHYLNRKRGYEE